MKIYKNSKVVFYIFLLSLFFIFPLNTYSDFSIRVSPFRIEETVEPGDVVVKSVNVTNVSDGHQTFYVFLKDFTAKGEGGEPLLFEAGSREGPFLTSWIEVPSEGYQFEPNEQKRISIQFNVPENVGPGGYYGAIVFGPKPPETVDGEGTVISLAHQVGTLALFRVAGEADVRARIREFATDKSIYDNPFQVTFLTRIENLGNVHIKPVGSIKVENMRGRSVATLQINETGANVLPESIRRFQNTWEEDIGFGKYTAYLVLNYEGIAADGSEAIQTIFAEKSFWIVPWSIVLPVVVGVVFLFLIIYYLFKRSKEKALKQVMQAAGLEHKKISKENKEESFYSMMIVLISVALVLLLGGIIFFLFFA